MSTFNRVNAMLRPGVPTTIVFPAGISTLIAVIVSAWSIYLQLKNYRKPNLQRMVVRIMLMVPIYAISSLVSLHSVEAAFVIDAIRDIYEAFVIYCFFVLLLTYLGGERSLLIMLHGRPPKYPIFPMNLFKREIDVSDPHTFLFMKRGIFQYVQVKPLLAAATLILKACGKYNEGDFRANSGYLYISIIYNTSICLSLYCLAMFWTCVSDDLKPFRPVPKFLCVKGILFFSFWQSVGISILVATHIITKLGPYTDPEHVSTGWNNLFICVEMPVFGFLHMFAFSYKDYIDLHHTFVARMPFYYAFRDAFGLKDVVEDSKATLRGEGMDYREFEPAEGVMHQGEGRERRMRAGLRYSRGGQKKYWLPKADATPYMNRDSAHAPLLPHQAQDAVHLASDMMHDRDDEPSFWGDPQVEDGYDLPFGETNEEDEQLFEHSKSYLFGDYNYPCVDVSTEGARRVMWDEEERVLRDERGAWFSPIRGAKGQEAIHKRDAPVWQGYGAVGSTSKPSRQEIRQLAPSSSSQTPMAALQDSSSSAGSSSGKLRPPSLAHRPTTRSSPVLPSDAVDLVVEDTIAEAEEHTMDRRKGEPAVRSSGLRKIYRAGFETESVKGEVEVEDPSHRDGRRVDAAEIIINRIEDDNVDGVHERTRSTWDRPDRVVARAETPPMHARVDAYQFDDIPSPDHNPWA